ncbi:MAG: SRPBCC family protein [Nannocystales bacterium]
MNDTDKIHKQIVLRAPRKRVWEAITDAKQFGTWFGVEFDEAFVAGHRVHGRIVPTRVDLEVAKSQEPYAGLEFDVCVDRIEPMDHFSFRWHPGSSTDASSTDDEMTRVAFELADAEDGVLLTITESGFDRVPLERRAKAFTDNDGGWSAQTKLIRKYLDDAT